MKTMRKCIYENHQLLSAVRDKGGDMLRADCSGVDTKIRDVFPKELGNLEMKLRLFAFRSLL